MSNTESCVAALLVLGLLASSAAASGPDDAKASEAAAPRPVVLELFTSQGCSSCPPAEELLSRLGLEDGTRTLVVPLAFHVDYWNQLGWTDPFSASAWSRRQEVYCRALAVDGGPYTPQLVVDGQAELNGAQGQRLVGALGAAQRRPVVARVSLEAARGQAGKDALDVTLGAEVVADVEARKLELMVAVFENGIVTPIGRGENRGRTLRNDFIVRRLESALSLPARKGESQRRTLALKLEKGWKTENLGLAAFLQDPASMRIHAAAVVPPANATPVGRGGADRDGSLAPTAAPAR